jgi:hypothetical protein
MRLTVRKFIADNNGLEPVCNAQPRKHHFSVRARRIRHRDYGDIFTIGQHKKRHQSGQVAC